MLALEDIMDFHQLRQQGMSLRAISRHTGYNRGTVTKYLKNGLKEPRYKPRKPGPGKLDPYRDYLGNRLESFPQLSGQRLFREIRDRGYQGGYSILTSYLRTIRPKPPVDFEVRFETPPGEQALVSVACTWVPSGRSSGTWLSSGDDGRCDGKWPEGTFPVALTDENP